MSGTIMPGSYDPAFVFLSVVIAIFASYTALELAGCTTLSKGHLRAVWISGGAVAMGIGIWSMHYTGMLAFQLPVPVLYNLPVVGLSLLAAIAAAAVALVVVSRPALSLKRLIIGSLTMGAGIFAMHYIGMAAMRLPACCFFNPWIVAASGVIAVVVSGAALWIAFRLRSGVAQFGWLRLASAVLMGVAIAAMHYTGMAAVSFRSRPMADYSADDVSISAVAAQAIVVVTLVILLLAIVAVIAARHLSDQAELLKNTQAEYRLLVEHNLAAIIRTTADGHVLEANQTAMDILGYRSREEMLGIAIENHYWSAKDRIRILRALKLHGVVSGIEICLRRTNGEPVWILCNLVLVKNVNTGHPEIVTTAMDISGMKKIHDDLRCAKEAAEAANRAKSRFLANMSHELRTPLNGILGMTSLALDSNLPADARGYLEDAKMSADGLLRIINDVLDYSKIEAHRVTFRQEVFSLHRVLEECIRTLAVPAGLKRIYLDCKMQTALPDRVCGDSERLRQILLNLLGNAVKFTDRGGVVLSVKSQAAGEDAVAIHVRISDTGVGIPSDKLDFIFGAFVQTDSSDSRRFGGTGLGLAISSQLAAAMNGKLWAESTLGVGSTFHLLVTLGRPPAEEDATPTAGIRRSEANTVLAGVAPSSRRLQPDSPAAAS